MHCRHLLRNAYFFLKHVWHWPWSWNAYAGSWRATGEEACLGAPCGEMEATECTSQENTAAHGFLSGWDWVLSVILVSWKQPRLRGRSCHLPKTHTVVVKVLAYKEHVKRFLQFSFFCDGMNGTHTTFSQKKNNNKKTLMRLQTLHCINITVISLWLSQVQHKY